MTALLGILLVMLRVTLREILLHLVNLLVEVRQGQRILMLRGELLV